VRRLLDLGAARSVFVHECKSDTLLCTLPRNHESRTMLASILDEALASYITNLADGCVKFAWRFQDDMNSLPHIDGASDALDHTSVKTSAGASSLTQASLSASRGKDPAAVFERGDMVSLIHGLPGSTCLISTRNTYNSPACSLCLGAASLGRVGIVIGGEAMQVASLSSGASALLLLYCCFTAALLLLY
jgi:hypothetical protein